MINDLRDFGLVGVTEMETDFESQVRPSSWCRTSVLRINVF